MKHTSIYFSGICIFSALVLSQCQSGSDVKVASATTDKPYYGGYESAEQWGQHIITVSGCHDCHSPKKMTATGPVIDSTRMLSGHPADMPDFDVNRQDLESKGVAATRDLTAWVGPWGISYTANLTSDATGIGNWTEGQFIYAIRNGTMKGLAGSRPMLPPMPWQMYRNMTDDELKAIFAYLKTTK